MNFRRKKRHRSGKGALRRITRRQMRRKSKFSEAFRDSMRAIRRGYGFGIPK